MGSFFARDNAYTGFMSKAFDLCVLNLVFFISCLPIFTIGAALTAMYTMLERTAKNEQSALVRSYFAEFKRSFKSSTRLFILPLLALVLIVFDLWYWSINGIGMGVAFAAVLLVVWGMMMYWLFPMTVRFENSAKNMLKNSFKFAISFLPVTIVSVVLGLVYCAALMSFEMLMPFVPVFALVLMLYPQSLYTSRCFNKYISEREDA